MPNIIRLGTICKNLKLKILTKFSIFLFQNQNVYVGSGVFPFRTPLKPEKNPNPSLHKLKTLHQEKVGKVSWRTRVK
jgi:hypothetical protein